MSSSPPASRRLLGAPPSLTLAVGGSGQAADQRGAIEPHGIALARSSIASRATFWGDAIERAGIYAKRTKQERDGPDVERLVVSGDPSGSAVRQSGHSTGDA